MKLGTKIIWLRTAASLSGKEIAEGTITRVGKDTYYVDNAHKWEDQIYAAYVLPDSDKARRTLQNFIDEEARHNLEDKANMACLYQLRNELIRKGEL